MYMSLSQPDTILLVALVSVCAVLYTKASTCTGNWTGSLPWMVANPVRTTYINHGCNHKVCWNSQGIKFCQDF